MANFSWKTEKAAKGLVLLKLQGEMTLGAREAMREAFESLVSSTESVAAVDFTDVKLVSSGAIGELVRCQSRLSALNRKFHLVCPPGDVLETLMVADMHRLIPLHSDISSLVKGRSQ